MTAPPAVNRGVYFLANDHVYNLAVAFLNSFRAHNPTLSLCMIPFDGKSEKVRALQPHYDFAVLDDRDIMQRCDWLGTYLQSRTYGCYRKFALWHGPFDEFIYIDLDTVILRDIGFVFSLLLERDFIMANGGVKWVWKDSIRDTQALTEKQIGFGGNAGFIASRKSALSLDVVEAKLGEVAPLLPHMADLPCKEQSLLNYLFVKSGRAHALLSQLAERYPEACEFWAGSKGGIVRGGEFTRPDGRKPFMMHWSGEWQPRELEAKIRWKLRRIGIGCSEIRLRMPYRSLWTHYRYLRH